MSRVCPECPQTTAREAREGSCIRNAYGEHDAEVGVSREKAQKTQEKAILSLLLCLLRLFAAVLQNLRSFVSICGSSVQQATQSHPNATPMRPESHPARCATRQ